MKLLHIFMICCVASALICALIAPAMADEQHEGDWAFGIDNGNAAVIEPEPDEIEPVHLHPFTAGLFNGDWGLEFWNLPDPDLKSVRVEFTSAPTGLVLFHGGTLVLGSDGTSTGPGYFDMAWPDPGIHHAHIDAYATALGEYGVTFKLVNAIANDGQNTALGDSGEYSVSFHAVPEPSSLLALLTPMAAFVVRRRR